jgi:hypothetical protein
MLLNMRQRPPNLSPKPERRKRQAYWMKEKWSADFSKSAKTCFDIKPEITSNP